VLLEAGDVVTTTFAKSAQADDGLTRGKHVPIQLAANGTFVAAAHNESSALHVCQISLELCLLMSSALLKTSPPIEAGARFLVADSLFR